jgi:hypothetical protein
MSFLERFAPANIYQRLNFVRLFAGFGLRQIDDEIARVGEIEDLAGLAIQHVRGDGLAGEIGDPRLPLLALRIHLGIGLLRPGELGPLHGLRLQPAFAVNRIPAKIIGNGEEDGRRGHGIEAMFKGAKQTISLTGGTNPELARFCLSTRIFARGFRPIRMILINFIVTRRLATILPRFGRDPAVWRPYMTTIRAWRLGMMNLKLLALGAAIIGSTALLAAPNAMADWHGGGGGDYHGGGGNYHGGGDWHGHGDPYGGRGWYDAGRHWHWNAGYGPAYGYYGPPPVYYAPPPVYYAPPPPVYYAPPRVYVAPPSVVITPGGIGIAP